MCAFHVSHTAAFPVDLYVESVESPQFTLYNGVGRIFTKKSKAARSLRRQQGRRAPVHRIICTLASLPIVGPMTYISEDIKWRSEQRMQFTQAMWLSQQVLGTPISAISGRGTPISGHIRPRHTLTLSGHIRGQDSALKLLKKCRIWVPVNLFSEQRHRVIRASLCTTPPFYLDPPLGPWTFQKVQPTLPEGGVGPWTF